MLSRNIPLLKALYFFNGMHLFAALAIVYYQQITGSYALGMLAFALVTIAQSVMEIPCGIFSDKISRKTTLLLASIFMFLNVCLWALAGYMNSAIILFVGSCFRGIGLAFRSGTDTALAYETLQKEKKTNNFFSVISKINAVYELGTVISTIIATVIIYYFSLQTLVTLTIIPYFITVIIALFFVNPPRRKSKKSSFDFFKQGLKYFIRNKRLRRYVLFGATTHSIEVSTVRFEATYFEKLVPLYLINIARLLQNTFGWISFYIAGMFKKTHLLKLLYSSVIGSIVVKFIALVMNNSITPFINAAQNLFYGPKEVSKKSLNQKEYTNSLRATMDSITGLINALFAGIVSVLFGMFGDIFGPRPVLFGALVITLVISLHYKKVLKIHKK